MKLEQAWRLSSSGCSFLSNVLVKKRPRKKCIACKPCVFFPFLLFDFKDVTLITIYDSHSRSQCDFVRHYECPNHSPWPSLHCIVFVQWPPVHAFLLLVSFHWHATNVSTLLVLMLPLLLLLLLWCKIHGIEITFACSSRNGVSKLQTDRTQSRKSFLLTDELLSLKTSARFHKTFQPAFGRILHKMCSGHNSTQNFLYFFFFIRPIVFYFF